MKKKLIDQYYDLQLNLPSINYYEGAAIRGQMYRIAVVLWERYRYDIDLTHSFSLTK